MPTLLSVRLPKGPSLQQGFPLYPITRKVGTVNYAIDIHDTSMRELTFHTNMLKKWNTPSQDCYSMMVDADGLLDEEGEGDIPVWKDDSSGEQY